MRISQSRDLKFTLTWAGAFVCSPAPSAFHLQTRPSWWAVWVAQATSRAQAPGHTVGLHSPDQGRPSTMTGTASALSPNRFPGLLTLTRKTEWNPHGTREPGAQEAEGIRRGRACETPRFHWGAGERPYFLLWISVDTVSSFSINFDGQDLSAQGAWRVPMRVHRPASRPAVPLLPLQPSQDCRTSALPKHGVWPTRFVFRFLPLEFTELFSEELLGLLPFKNGFRVVKADGSQCSR